jgi:glycosyltransferase involved in cell wall biosynthesis
MNILMLNYEFPPIGGGGGQAHRSLLTQYARRDDLRIDVLTSAAAPGFVTETFSPNISIHRVGLHKKHLHFWRKTEVLEWLRKAKSPYHRLLRDNAYDVIHAFFGFPTGWLCYRTAGRVPYVISLRGSDVPGGNARLQLEYKLLGPLLFKPVWRHAAALVACSEGLRTRALEFMPSAQIDVILNGVDLERFHPAKATPDGSAIQTGIQPLRLLTVGRLSTTKRLPLLIESLEVLDAVSRALVGGGARGGGIRRMGGQKGLQSRVTLRGRVDAAEMPEIYRGHDLFVSASAQEGMSNAMLEAMASGLAIVTTRCEGVDELIGDNGLVVDEPTAAALARVVRSLIEAPTTLEAMSRAARRSAEKLTWEAVAQAYLELYNRVK